MPPDQLEVSLKAALADRQLRDHPFYRRWEAGTLQPGELGDYVAQYRYLEASVMSSADDIRRSHRVECS
jgi:pyrroloquinoline quinone (PQQ) biosynthesis protein C